MMNNTKQVLSKHNRLSSWSILLAMPFFMWWSSLDHVSRSAARETNNNPVMVDGAWGPTVRTVEGGIVVQNSRAYKQRTCGWVETLFFLGARDGVYASIGRSSGLDEVARHLSKPKGREIGPQVWGEIFLPVTEEQFRAGLVFADVLHKCDPDSPRTTLSRLFN